MGYEFAAFKGEKSYNGVLILSKQKIVNVEKFNFCGKDDARHIGIELEDGIKVHNLYIPAGGDLPDTKLNPKFEHKISFLSEIKDKFYWIRTLITKNTEIPEMGKDFVDVAFEITKKNDKYFLAKSNNSINSKSLSELDFYTNSFSVKRGLDHPNEISAYMFSDFFKKNYSLKSQYVEKTASADNNYELFLNWIKQEMK